MNTPGHAVLNLALLGRRNHPDRSLPIVAGAVLPDVPIFVFFVWERLVRGMPDRLIWTERYFDPAWQRAFDVPHSIPLALAGVLLAGRAYPAVAMLFASVLIHSCIDLPLHNDDAHRHFLPFSAWRYASPVSYWDPARYGTIAALAELVTVTVAATVVWRRLASAQREISRNGRRSTAAKAALGAVVALYVAAYALLYLD
jgi:hypothetical protein